MSVDDEIKEAIKSLADLVNAYDDFLKSIKIRLDSIDDNIDFLIMRGKKPREKKENVLPSTATFFIEEPFDPQHWYKLTRDVDNPQQILLSHSGGKSLPINQRDFFDVIEFMWRRENFKNK